MNSEQETKVNLSSLLLYVFGFLLLWEWLRPLELLTNTGNINVFLFFLIISMVLSFYNIRFTIGLFIKGIYILFVIQYLYFEGSFFQFGWVGALFKDLIENFKLVLEANWISLSDPFRSLLFFILLWLMTYLIQYWLINRKQIFIFFLMTLIYITVLDTFTEYKATMAIIRTIITGFGLMGILTFYRLLDREGIKKEFHFSKKWMTPLTVMIIFSVLVGFASHKPDPIWPDPVPFIKSYAEGSGDGGGSSLSKVGYGTNDSQLGGPFIGDNQVVYRTEATKSHYWKVETKDVYTGKGWIVTDEALRIPFTQDEKAPISSFVSKSVNLEQQTSKVYSEKNYPHIIYPLGVTKVQAGISDSFELDPSMEKIYSLNTSRVQSLDEYSVEFDIPEYSVKALMATTGNTTTKLTQDFIEKYTQLPPTLPQRVKDLAVEITSGKETWFDKAREVERYFNRSEYTYDQVNVAVPGDQDDYVDQFLFETKSGYCDNFSSSMVVMLRSIGIPSRWVKGYTEGEFQGPAPQSKKLFHITNNNAHSWVEVFFPDVGWVPFEPTQGFSINVNYNFDTGEQQDIQTTIPEKNEEPTEKQPDLKEKDIEKTEDTPSVTWKTMWSKTKTYLNSHFDTILLFLLITGLVVFLIYKNRLRWLPHFLLLTFKWRKKDEDFVKAYLVLLTQLQRYGLKRETDQTLREYARYIDRFFSSKEMEQLTVKYEQYLYKGSLQEGSWMETKELWENLIKRTIA